ncbi:MAG: hypothetical protein GC178_07100 [Flavobacteriales bacterium]|nr:hypothetical protein [Flavobacteriales bacterium]
MRHAITLLLVLLVEVCFGQSTEFDDKLYLYLLVDTIETKVDSIDLVLEDGPNETIVSIEEGLFSLSKYSDNSVVDSLFVHTPDNTFKLKLNLVATVFVLKSSITTVIVPREENIDCTEILLHNRGKNLFCCSDFLTPGACERTASITINPNECLLRRFEKLVIDCYPVRCHLFGGTPASKE